MKLNSKNLLIGCLAVFLTAGCTTYNAATGRNEFIAISTSQEIAMGRDIHTQIDKEEKISTDAALVERVNAIGQRLAQVSDRQDFLYKFYVVEKDELNAFTVPGGSIYIYTGLINKLKSDDQIAAVLAHEIGHGAARHTVKKFQAALGYNLIGTIIFTQLEMEAQAKQLAALGSNAVMSIVFSAYGRHDEFEADRLGVKYMYLAGFNTDASFEVLEVLKKESKPSHVPLILRTHPYLDDRIKVVKQEIQAVTANFGGAS